MAALEGQQLGSYRLIRLLGQGGFADVYLGQKSQLSLYLWRSGDCQKHAAYLSAIGVWPPAETWNVWQWWLG
jgi:serine/threonine protein kinase